jgi:hypothetical protein
MLCLCLLLIALIPAAAQADEVIAEPGSGAGQTQEATSLATDEARDLLFVADRGNRRVDVFDASSGSFIRAFGWGVVASGPGNKPRNEKQEVKVEATGGAFTLLFISNTFLDVQKFETVPIPFDATAATVESALEGLTPLAPGDVSVTGPAGGPWTIEFEGAYADTDVLQFEEGQASDLTGGAGELVITTPQPGANYEVCEPADGDACREGQRGVFAGQLSPLSVAVEPLTGDVYVFDGLETNSAESLPNNRVQRFTAEGEFKYMLGGGVNTVTGEDICTKASEASCGRGQKGTGAGEFNAERSSIAVGPGGILYVNDGGRVQKFDNTGAFLGEVSLPGISSEQLEVDSSGDIYGVASPEIRKYDPSGTLIDATTSSFVTAITLDSSGSLYAAAQGNGRPGISRYDSSLDLNLVFYNSLVGLVSAPERALSIAPTGVFSINGNRVFLTDLPPPGPVVYPVPGAATADPIGNLRATLNSEVNPEGKATTYHFEYIEQSAFESSGGWSSPAVKETPESASIGSDYNLHDVQAVIGCSSPETEASSCLTPSTEYRFRVVATNADGSNAGPDTVFETKPPVEFGPLWITGVGTDTATLHAELNPVGFASTGYFELVTEAQFQATEFAGAIKIPAGTPLDFGSGEAFVERSAVAADLQPGTIYRYRLVVTNNCKPAEPTFICTSESDFEDPAPTFTTFSPPTPIGPSCANAAFRSGPPAAFLPDCRAYEMVSPVDKNGASIETGFNFTNYPASIDQGARDGNSITYSASMSFADPEGAPFSSQYLSRRGTSGWSVKSISPPREGPMIFEPDAIDFQFKGFTEDLCFGWVRQDTAKPLLAPAAIPEFENIYRRDNCQPGEGGWLGVTSTLVAPPPEPRDFEPHLEGFSADGSKAVFSAIGKLTSNARNNQRQAYEVVNEVPKLVCVLPGAGGATPTGGCTLGSGPSSSERERNLFNAVSDDGSRVFWNANERLYVRIGGTESFAVSQTVNNDPAFFWGAASDGSKAIFTTAGNELYDFDVATKTPTKVAEGVLGVAGMSEDASRIYFVSNQELATGAEAGKANLYFTEGGEETFIATLPDTLLLLNPIAREPFRRTSRVTPDGEHIVFMSNGSLTGYDNADAVSGEDDQEVFRFDATANGGTGALTCVSCNPTGARPEGRKLDLFLGIQNFWVASAIPTWNSQLSAPRVISDDGSRVFFNSFDRLASQDVNGKADAYQWEILGAGDCSEDMPTYSPSAGGCISLISSGESDEDSFYVDSSASGDDVFFKTYSSLVPQDPAFIDVYDARVGGGFATPPPPPNCNPDVPGECQAPPPPPPPAVAPASQVPGPGNPRQTKKPRKCPKGKHKVKRKGKIVCVKNKKAQKKRNSGRAGR